MLRMAPGHPVTRPHLEFPASWPSSPLPGRKKVLHFISPFYPHLLCSFLRLCEPLEGGGLQGLPPVLDLLQLLLELLGGEARGLRAWGDGRLLRRLGVLQDNLNNVICQMRSLSMQQILHLEAQTSGLDISFRDLGSFWFLIHFWHSDKEKIRISFD